MRKDFGLSCNAADGRYKPTGRMQRKENKNGMDLQ